MSTANPESRRHRAVTVNHGENCEEIDELLAPLILELWKAGIQTMMSCQETEPGISWIEFDSSKDLLEFLNISGRYGADEESLYHRMCTDVFASEEATNWVYQFNLMDLEEGPLERSLHGTVWFEEHVGAYFPQSDIPVLLSRLQEFNHHSHCPGQ